jgi:hypothetical protein
VIKASDWRPIERGSLRGFCTLTLSPSGLILHDCAVHQHANGARWVGLPGKPQVTADGRIRKDPGSGKTLYSPIVEIADREARERFRGAALAAVEEMLGEADSSEPTAPRAPRRPRQAPCAYRRRPQ